MENDSNKLSDDDLWAKCQQGGAITSNDLGINSSQNSSDGSTYLTEGTNYHQFELNSKDKKKK